MQLNEFQQLFSTFGSKPIGHGGQKIVYHGTHHEYGPVVIKRIIKPSPRIEREVSIIEKHTFKNVPKILKVLHVDWEGEPSQVIIEEYVDGTSLRDVIRQGERYNLKQAVRFLEEGLIFLQSISSQGIIHRDIKPENIIFARTGHYYFLDFGIARDLNDSSLTRTGEIGPNTPGYAAPELFLGDKEDIDARADLFSLGVVAYELLSGSNPFITEDGYNAFRIYNNTMTITPLDFTIEGDDEMQLMGFISALMSKERYKRPRDANAAMDWLKRTVELLSLEER